MKMLPVISLLAIAAATVPHADAADNASPFLSPMFSDNMVLQRDIADPIWGWTTPGATITVQIAGKKATATADRDGKWLTKVGPLPVGGPYELTVSGPTSVTLKNILVGDVWICSGQSNMEFGIGNVNNAADEIAHADNPQIRLFTVTKKVALTPQNDIVRRDADLMGQWSVCTPKSVSTGGWGGFSAVGYFFGRTLYDTIKVPIGLVHTSWGGTQAEAWTSAGALEKLPDFQNRVQQMMTLAADRTNADYPARMAQWYSANDPGTGTAGNGAPWAAPNFDTSSWKTMRLPTAWEQAGLPDFDGIVWFRTTFEVPAAAEGKDLMLNLGPIDDNDTTWVNGQQVGATEGYLIGRSYRVPGALVKSGTNTVAVRVLDTGGAGGLWGKPEQLSVEIPGQPSISLAGDWRYQAGVPLSKTTPVPLKFDPNDPSVVTGLYNGMIAPVVPYGIKGAIWYQGEANAGRAYQYRSLLPTMIQDWRSRFGVGDFPFYIVQLAGFMPHVDTPQESDWAELREAQAMSARNIKNSGLAVAIDIGDPNDIHPKNKQEVGRRLALVALHDTYGQKIASSGPTYRSMKIKDGAIRLQFDHTEGGLVAKDGKLAEFSIAGEDRKFFWANAIIDGDTIVVSAKEVPSPVAVRYAWSGSPLCSLYNKAGLPAVPFRTDDWPGVTINNK